MVRPASLPVLPATRSQSLTFAYASAQDQTTAPGFRHPTEASSAPTRPVALSGLGLGPYYRKSIPASVSLRPVAVRVSGFGDPQGGPSLPPNSKDFPRRASSEGAPSNSESLFDRVSEILQMSPLQISANLDECCFIGVVRLRGHLLKSPKAAI